ncbi:MAG: ATP-dependent 6-phosphofructokinase [Eubacteriales bacterium]|nr:ATP-dependent 6-phosphofructokinase [Eubacteriales bacterium]
MKIGMLTSGGDCQGLNAALRGVAKTLYNELGDKVTLYGIRDGYRGLIEGDYHEMNSRDFSDILTVGGTILGTSRQPFKEMTKAAEDSEETKLEKMLKTVKEAKFDCLVILGGNGTHKTANLLSEHGVNVVTLPKTIDNDLWGTEMTFGFQSAVDIATTVIDAIHSTAFSHSRVFIVETMGHKAGWLTLYAGIASGADIIVIPEIPYSAEKIADAIKRREKGGKRFSILAVAEGAVSQEEAKMSKKEFKAAREKMPYPSISYRLADELAALTGHEIRVTIPGHYQRGGAPCPADRLLTTRLGVAAAQLIRDGRFGNMVAVQDDRIVPVPLSEVAGKLKTVPPDSDIVQAARDLGLSMGD